MPGCVKIFKANDHDHLELLLRMGNTYSNGLLIRFIIGS